jgi:group II intron reverse transcriptase/maturase
VSERCPATTFAGWEETGRLARPFRTKEKSAEAQQALLQVLTPMFDPHISDRSYGFRPGRSAHEAVRRAQEAIGGGHTWVVDLDLEAFFDRVNHDALMARCARRIDDKKVLKLLLAYLNAGVMPDGVKVLQEEGSPQGSPLTPLLASIMLDDLDQELSGRGHLFVRYADDIMIYVKTKRAGERVMQSARTFIAKRPVDRPSAEGRRGSAPITVASVSVWPLAQLRSAAKAQLLTLK